MARPEKDAAVAQLADKFREANAVLLTEYRGLSVADLKELRRSLAGNAEYTVAKNTLAAIAARRVGLDAIVDDLKGPTALTFVTGEPVEAAKALRDFAKDNKNLIVKGGVMEGNALSADEVDKLASLESREVLLAKAAGAMKASLSKAAYLFAAPASKAVRTVDALREKQETAA
ncbi:MULTISPECIES: 50S ribosomal protein L10 [unclassified Actinomyces]|uniref:50S ribosomal protein L10 n=1 Tax=unclassified Actinomyces TaxID=2609248 RepID=UPI001373CECB|nr:MULTISPECIES: 50S ribosomal protein L10 [unclassified Actinomyces]MBW3069958.1 50S ribosomal protein L10 [Actinomyces sp. 594]NDR52826.1 50S ribosomal protein L10 [Actinomyces sp. 565]QHO91667.1 50S ribosomal protein L10 [Actinomyces sp. 432]